MKPADSVARREPSYGNAVEPHASEFSGVLEKTKAVAQAMSPRVRQHLIALIGDKVRESVKVAQDGHVLRKGMEGDMIKSVTRFARKAYGIG